MMRAVLVLLALVAGSNALLGVSQTTNLRNSANANFLGPFTNGLYKAAIQPNHDYIYVSSPEAVLQGTGATIVRDGSSFIPGTRTAYNVISVATVVAVGPAAGAYKVGDKIVIPTQCSNSINALTGLANLPLPFAPPRQAPACSLTGVVPDGGNPADFPCTSIGDARCLTCALTDCISIQINDNQIGGLVPQGLVLGKYSVGSQSINDGISGPSRFSNVGTRFPAI